LNNCITQLVVLERAIKEWWDIDKFVDYILNKKNVYSNDETWEQILAFLRDNAIQIITAIWCAVALVAAIPTWWMSLLWMAAIMTAGSMGWLRLWTELNNLVQNTIFKTTIKVWDEEIEIRFDDPSDVRMWWNWKLSLQDFLINAWTEFVKWTVTCFWFMKAWQLIGKSISWYLSKNPNTKAEAFLKRINPKFAETKTLLQIRCLKMQRVKLTKIFEEVGQINLKLSFEKNCEKRRLKHELMKLQIVLISHYCDYWFLHGIL
jgi:hypothetical protein